MGLIQQEGVQKPHEPTENKKEKEEEKWKQKA
jgi:hypothetical protein